MLAPRRGRRLHDRGGQAAEQQVALQRDPQRRQVRARVEQRRPALVAQQLADRQAGPGWQPIRGAGAREGGEALRQHQHVATRPATARQPLGGALRKIDRRGAGADHDIAVEQPVVPQRLDRGAPTAGRGDLVQQDQPRPLPSIPGELERPLHGRN
jgi:hypothetical protein